MGYDRTGFDQPTAFRIRQMNTMSEDGTVCNQSCPLVYFQVILAVGTQGKRAVDLVFILGKMRLYISARILFVQTSSRNQLFRRTGDGKTGRDDIAVPPFSMPRFDQRTTFGFPCSAVSVNPAGAFRSISTFPVSIHILYSDATEKRAVTDVGCTVA